MSDSEEPPPQEEEDPNPNPNPPSPSLAGSDASAPPPVNGQQLSAAKLSFHPVWAASRGEGPRPAVPPVGGGKKRSKAPSEVGDAGAVPKYERISLAELEARQHADADGADSRIDSEDEDEWTRIARAPPGPSATKRKRKAKGPREETRAGVKDDERDLVTSEDDEDDEDDEGDGGGGGGGGDEGGRRRKLAGLMGQAAFGGGGAHHYGASDAASEQSVTSSKRRKDAMKDAFPVRGLSCVGCALSNRIGPVNRFVKDYISQMTEDALFKMAALCYRREVAEPAEREGAPVPPWSWKDVRSHYELHNTGNWVARHKMIRQLQCMRSQAEQRLVRVDNGEKELDRVNADMLLKIIAAESKERQLLDSELSKRK